MQSRWWMAAGTRGRLTALHFDDQPLRGDGDRGAGCGRFPVEHAQQLLDGHSVVAAEYFDDLLLARGAALLAEIVSRRTGRAHLRRGADRALPAAAPTAGLNGTCWLAGLNDPAHAPRVALDGDSHRIDHRAIEARDVSRLARPVASQPIAQWPAARSPRLSRRPRSRRRLPPRGRVRSRPRSLPRRRPLLRRQAAQFGSPHC